MSLVINTNNIATIASRNLATNQTNLQKSLARLSSGSKIVTPADDAGGLAVANKLKAVMSRNVRANQNVQNSLSFLQVQDGAMKVASQILDRMSELKTMSLDVTKNAEDIANYDAEFTQLQQQLVNIQNEKFNGINLFDASTNLTTYTTERGDSSGEPTVTVTRGGLFDNLSGTGSYGGTEVSVDLYDDNTAYAVGALIKGKNDAGVEQVAVVTSAITGTDGNSFSDESANYTVLSNSTNPHSKVWEDTTTFTQGDVVFHDESNKYYVAVGATGDYSDATNAASIPGSSAEWAELSAALPSVSASAEFDASTSYNKHDVVSYNNKVYVAKDDAVSGGTGDPVANAAEWQELSVYEETAGGKDLLTDSNSLSGFLVSDFVTFIQTAATARAQNGAEMQRLQWSSEMLTTNYSNVEAAHSRLHDVDFSLESTAFAKHNILTQSAAAMLSQANSVPNVALQLLG